MLSQGVVFDTDRLGVQEGRDSIIRQNTISILELDSSDKFHILRKVRKLCEYLPNLLINDAALTLGAPVRDVAVAIILESRRKCCIEPIWPVQLSFMVFGEEKYDDARIKAALRYI